MSTPDTVERIRADAIAALRGYRWPGNVRELENLVYKLVVFSAQLGPGRPRPL